MGEAKAKAAEVRALGEATAEALDIQVVYIVNTNMFYLLLVCNALLLQWSLHDTVHARCTRCTAVTA